MATKPPTTVWLKFASPSSRLPTMKYHLLFLRTSVNFVLDLFTTFLDLSEMHRRIYFHRRITKFHRNIFHQKTMFQRKKKPSKIHVFREGRISHLASLHRPRSSPPADRRSRGPQKPRQRAALPQGGGNRCFGGLRWKQMVEIGQWKQLLEWRFIVREWWM